MAVVFPVKRRQPAGDLAGLVSSHQPADDLAGPVSSHQDRPSPKRPRVEDGAVASGDVVDLERPCSVSTAILPADPSSLGNANSRRTSVETSASYLKDHREQRE